MNIQTLSIVVPTKGCINHCKFCVSRMRENCNFHDKFDECEIEKRIKYAVMNNVNTCILTGTGEALQNKTFLNKLLSLFNRMNHPFPNIELQTTGVMLNKVETIANEKTGKEESIYPNLIFLKQLGVTTISLSVSNVFKYKRNLEIIDVPKKYHFILSELITRIKEYGFNVRLSLNMISDYDSVTPQTIFAKCKELGADQITFRKLYYTKDLSFSQNKWVMEHRCLDEVISNIENYIKGKKAFGHYFSVPRGTYLHTLPFGGKVYSVSGMSVVIDDDCMSKHVNDTLKYVILRENGKLYSRWDDEGSLIF